MERILYLIILAITLTLTSVYLSSCQSKIVAEVEQQKITQEELNQELNKQYGMEVLQNLITQRLILLEAKKKNVNVTEQELNQEMEKIALNLGGMDKLQEQIKSKGITIQEYKEKLKLDILLKKLIISEISEEEIKVFYENNKGNLPIVEVSFIMVPDKTLAESIIKNLKQGGDFNKLAETYSQDPITKDTKGYVGFLARYDISKNSPTLKVLEEAIFKNPKKGEVIGPIAVKYNNQNLYYIVKYHNVLKTYEEVKPKIQDLLAQQRIQEKIENLRKNANIKIMYGPYTESKK
ncbi:MAG: SurA N-terminal domain-containing protein [bacterium]